MDFPASKSIYVQPHIKKTGTLVILWTRDFRAHSEMVSNMFWMGGGEGGESEGENKRVEEVSYEL
jgi:hypothetical protein